MDIWKSLLTASLTVTLTADPATASTMAKTGMKRIVSIYSANRRSAPRDVTVGDEASMACMATIFLDWYQLYSPELAQFTPLERQSEEFKGFDEAAEEAQNALTELFDASRPGLSDAIRQTLTDQRGKGQAPGEPESLMLEDVQEGQLTQNLMFCKRKDFLAKIAELVPPAASTGQALVRTVSLDVPDMTVAAASFYVPTHKVRMSLSRTYGEWIQIFAQGR